jgi:hypothetical protein
MCKKVLVVLFPLLFAALASAQIPSGNVFFGYSYYNTDINNTNRVNTNGWDASAEGKIIPLIGIVADFDGHYGSQNFGVACTIAPRCTFNASFTEHNFLFGPRISIKLSKIRPFAEVLIGAGHVSVGNGGGSDTSFANAVGGGLDYKLIPLLAWRFEGDYVNTRFFGNTQNNFRFSTGIVVRF